LAFVGSAAVTAAKSGAW